MRRHALLILVALVAACKTPQLTPEQREAIAVEAYTGAVRALTVARRDGKIDAETWNEIIKPGIRAARSARQDVAAARRDGRTPDVVETALRAALAAMAEVVAYREELTP